MELLHIHYAIPHTSSAYLAKKALGKDIKIVTTLHGTNVHLVGEGPDKSSVRKLGYEARRRVLGKFTPQRIVPQYESLYQRTLAK